MDEPAGKLHLQAAQGGHRLSIEPVLNYYYTMANYYGYDHRTALLQTAAGYSRTP